MPGPVSDSYHPEWGTQARADDIDAALTKLYAKLSDIIARGIGPRDPRPINIRELVDSPNLSTRITATLSEQEWRLLRFGLERSRESL